MGQAWNRKKVEMRQLVVRAKTGDEAAIRELQRLSQENKYAKKFIFRELSGPRVRYATAALPKGGHEVSGGAYGLGKNRKQ